MTSATTAQPPEPGRFNVFSTTVTTVSWNTSGDLLGLSFDQEYSGETAGYRLYTQVFNINSGNTLVFTSEYRSRYMFWVPTEGSEHLLLVSDFGGIRRYDISTGNLIAEVSELDDGIWYGIQSASLNRASNTLTIVMTPLGLDEADANYQSAFAYDADSLTPLNIVQLPFRILREQANAISWAEFHPYSDIVATTHWDGRLRLWNSFGEESLQIIDVSPDQRLHTGAWSPDGRYIAVGGVDRKITIVDFERREVIHQIQTGAEVRYILWHPDSHQLYAAGSVWDAVTAKRIEIIDFNDNYSGAASWSPGGDLYFGRYFDHDAGIRSLTDSILDAGAVVIVSHRDPLVIAP